MKRLLVNIKQASYPILIGQGLLNNTELLQQNIHSRQVMIVSNDTIAKHHIDKLNQSLANLECATILLPDGEQFKTLETLTHIFDALIQHQFKRDATLIALGGGVIGDMTGFAANCYQRGIDFIQIPTSLLAQVDASIGGKTAVNYQDKKNFIGSFYQPKAVIIDIDTLNTLPQREFISGIAEVIKHAAIRDLGFFAWLEEHMPAILAKDFDTLIEMLYRSIAIKATIVSEDEQEALGIRDLLNFGHTFAHAIESATHYKTYLHGEAVAIGMVMAAELSQQQNLLTAIDVKRLKDLLVSAKLPITLHTTIDPTILENLMGYDKKNRFGKKRFVLLDGIGRAVIG